MVRTIRNTKTHTVWYNPGDRDLNLHRRENFMSRGIDMIFFKLMAHVSDIRSTA